MPTAYELELLAMTAAHRKQANHAQPQSEAALPDLTPEMLLSPSAQREVEAARGMARGPRNMADLLVGQSERQEWESLRSREALSRQPLETDFETSSADFELTDADLAPPIRGASRTPDAAELSLSALFMNREARDAVGAINAVGGDLSVYEGAGDDVSFDTGFAETSPAARWRAGRESPPAFEYREPPRSGPSDGVVVSSRTNGGWQNNPMPRQNATVSREEAVSRSRHEAREQALASPATNRSIAPRSTVYDRINRNF